MLPQVFEDYLNNLCGQIRWKRARRPVRRELAHHLCDQREAFLAQGLPQQEAEERALSEMGPLSQIGPALDRAWRPRPAWGMLSATLGLLVAGFFLRLLVAWLWGGSLPVGRELLVLAGAAGALAAGYFTDFTLLARLGRVFYLGFFALTLIILLLGIVLAGKSYLQNQWLPYLYLLLPVLYAGFIWSMEGTGLPGLLACGGTFILTAALGVVQGGMFLRTVFSCVIPCLAVLLTAIAGGHFGRRKKLYAAACLLPTVLLFTHLFIGSRQRWAIVLNPWLEPHGRGYWGILVQTVLRNAAFVGRGTPPGSSQVPTDDSQLFSLTFLVEQTGWISCIVILLLLGLFFALALNCWVKQRGLLARMACAALLLPLAFQAVFGLAASLGFTFFTSYPIPFLMPGTKALLVDSFLAGLLLSVLRCGHLGTERWQGSAWQPRLLR